MGSVGNVTDVVLEAINLKTGLKTKDEYSILATQQSPEFDTPKRKRIQIELKQPVGNVSKELVTDFSVLTS